MNSEPQMERLAAVKEKRRSTRRPCQPPTQSKHTGNGHENDENPQKEYLFHLSFVWGNLQVSNTFSKSSERPYDIITRPFVWEYGTGWANVPPAVQK